MRVYSTIKLLTLVVFFVSANLCYAVIDTGLGIGNGGAVINSATGGFVNSTQGANSATLNFNGDAHVYWETLNINSNETLNFNAVNNSNNITVLNTVNSGMTKIYGAINTNAGIKNLIISNPNGVLFDGTRFSTAADTNVTVTTIPMIHSFTNGKITVLTTNTTNNIGNVEIYNIQDNDFSIGGEFHIAAPALYGSTSNILAAGGVKLTTIDGQNYIATSTDNNINIGLVPWEEGEEISVGDDDYSDCSIQDWEYGGEINVDIDDDTTVSDWTYPNQTDTEDSNNAGSGNNTTIEDWTTGDDINISDNYNQNNTNTSDNLIRYYNKNAANDTLKSVFSTSEKQVKPNSSSLFSILRDFLGQNNDENNNSIIYTNIE